LKKWERIGGYCILAYAAGLIYQSLDLSLGSAGEPGSGFLGFFLGIGMAVSSLAVIFKNKGPELQSGGQSRKRSGGKGPGLSPYLRWQSWVLCGRDGNYRNYFEPRRLFLGVDEISGKKGLGMAVLVSLFGTTGFYVLFGVLLRIQFPRASWACKEIRP